MLANDEPANGDRLRTVLMVAFHFPPAKGSSGIQRTLKFARYLPRHRWRPAVLSANGRAYAQTSSEQMSEIPTVAAVKRTWCIDAARHLAVGGRYPKTLALPDRWVSWWLSAVPGGLSTIRKTGARVIWSTYPIATAHLIGYSLHRITGLPWIADFRDSMTEPGYPADPTAFKAYSAIERLASRHASALVFTTPGALRMYRARYPDAPGRDRWRVIPNGYDEENFPTSASQPPAEVPGSSMRPLLLVHSGLLDPADRDPTHFFRALATLRNRGAVTPERVRVVLRATGHDDIHRRAIAACGLEGLVHLERPVDYAAALSEMLHADALLIFQGASCNHQIPAKLYEYMHAGRPIIAFTDGAGDTAETLRSAGCLDIARMDDETSIAATLESVLSRLESGAARGAVPAIAQRYSRRALTGELASLLDELSPDGKR